MKNRALPVPGISLDERMVKKIPRAVLEHAVCVLARKGISKKLREALSSHGAVPVSIGSAVYAIRVSRAFPARFSRTPISDDTSSGKQFACSDQLC